MNWIDALPDAPRHAIKSAMVTRRFEKGALIFSRTESPDGLFLLRQGSALFFVDAENGERLLLHIIRPGELFGETFALDGRPAPVSVEARSPIETSFVPASRLAQLRGEHRAIESALAKVSSANLRRVLAALEELVLMPLPARTISRLRLLASEVPDTQRADDGIVLDIRQSELASMLGACRQAVNAELGKLEAHGLIERRFGKILFRPEFFGD